MTTAALDTFSSLLNFATGRPDDGPEASTQKKLQLAAAAALGSLVFAAIWGVAAGSRDLALVLGNLYKVPLVVLLGALASLPAGLLALKLSGARYRASDLVISYATAVFSGTLVLVVLSPLVGLYYATSAWAGPVLGMGSVFCALATAIFVFFRGAFRMRIAGTSRRALFIPCAVLVGMKLLMLLQLIALAAPILPELTVFDGGVDSIFH